GRAESVGREQHEAGVAHASRRPLAARERLARGAGEAQRRERARAVDAVVGGDLEARRIALAEREPAPRDGDDEEIRRPGAGHPGLGAREAARARARRPDLGLEAAARLAEGERGNALARRELREPALLLRTAPGERQGHARERVAEERARE